MCYELAWDLERGVRWPYWKFYRLPGRKAAIKHAEYGAQAEALGHINQVLGSHPRGADFVPVGNVAGVDCS